MMVVIIMEGIGHGGLERSEIAVLALGSGTRL